MGTGGGENRKIPVIYVKEGDQRRQRMAGLVRMCVCVCPFIAGALLVWGGGRDRFEGERVGDRRAQTDGRTDGRTYIRTETWCLLYRGRDVHPEYSRVLLLAHKLRLFSFSRYYLSDI